MARKDTLSYTPTTNDHDLDNQPPPDLDHKNNWSPDPWEAHNPKLIEFRDRLDDINHTSAAVMEYPQPLPNYPVVNRHQMINDYAKALANVDFHDDPHERLLTVQALSHHTFEPIYHHLHPDQMTDEHPLTPVINIYRELFTKALDASDPQDPDSIQLAHRALRDAQKYALNLTHDASNHTPDKFDEFTGHQNPIKRYDQCEKLVHTAWKDVDDELDDLHRQNNPAFASADMFLREARNSFHTYRLFDSTDQEEFNYVNQTATQGRDEFLDAIRNDHGFAPPVGYPQPTLPEEFTTFSDAANFYEATRQQLNATLDANQPMSRLALVLAQRTMTRLHGYLMETQEELETAVDQTDPEHRQEYFQQAQANLHSAHQSSQLMQFIMSPTHSSPTVAQ